ncbi:MAG: CotH kinase family protein, partial [Clostridia bacterium]|nr:CotH kinase family protein [Clostridia bacterium]
MASPWDFDYAFGNFYLDPDDPKGWICLGNELTDDYDEYIKTNWMDYLLKDEAFCKKLKTRWEQVSEKVLRAAENAIDRLKRECEPSAASNFKVWKNVLGEKIQYEKRSTARIATFDGNVEFLRTFIEKRFEWMDKEIKSY